MPILNLLFYRRTIIEVNSQVHRQSKNELKYDEEEAG